MSISQSPVTKQTSLWQQALKNLITDLDELLARLALHPAQLEAQVDLNFPLRISESFVARMKKGDPADPLLRQVLPIKKESEQTNGYSPDPLQEKQANPIPGLLQKFNNRVLLTLTPSCPVHCRYCFRRFFPYRENRVAKQGWPQIKAYLAQDPTIQEVILSGGDPLMLPNDQIAAFLNYIQDVQHIQIIRFHTRFPVIIPERITLDFIEMLKQQRFRFIMVYHINHPNELCPQIQSGTALLNQAGIMVLNQSVLLKGVNDHAEILTALSWKLMQHGILPYYIHQLDKVTGSAHFAVEHSHILALEHALRAALPGYLVPRFVQEVPGAPSKIQIV